MPANLAAQLRAWFGDSAGVSAAKIRGELPLYPEEERLIANAIPKRRAEFSTGRCCAREALKQVGFAPVAIGMGPLRGPLWPAGAVGSISHSAGLCVAVAGSSAIFQGLGVDLLDIREAGPTVAAAQTILAHPAETVPAGPLAIDPRILRFSAKESVIKAASGELGRWLEFSEIAVSLGQESFSAVVPGLPAQVHGWWDVQEGILLTAAKFLADEVS